MFGGWRVGKGGEREGEKEGGEGRGEGEREVAGGGKEEKGGGKWREGGRRKRGEGSVGRVCCRGVGLGRGYPGARPFPLSLLSSPCLGRIASSSSKHSHDNHRGSKATPMLALHHVDS